MRASRRRAVSALAVVAQQQAERERIGEVDAWQLSAVRAQVDVCAIPNHDDKRREGLREGEDLGSADKEQGVRWRGQWRAPAVVRMTASSLAGGASTATPLAGEGWYRSQSRSER